MTSCVSRLTPAPIYKDLQQTSLALLPLVSVGLNPPHDDGRKVASTISMWESRLQARR
jgi:hypothetical protein